MISHTKASTKFVDISTKVSLGTKFQSWGIPQQPATEALTGEPISNKRVDHLPWSARLLFNYRAIEPPEMNFKRLAGVYEPQNKMERKSETLPLALATWD